MVCEQVPRYAEVIEKGVGTFLRDPSKAAEGRLLFECAESREDHH
jgi:hypothetical protein